MPRGISGHSPANMAQHLKGIDFPADKQDLLDVAKQNGADEDVLEVIENLPDDEYQSMADVMKAYGRGGGVGDGAIANERDHRSRH